MVVGDYHRVLRVECGSAVTLLNPFYQVDSE